MQRFSYNLLAISPSGRSQNQTLSNKPFFAAVPSRSCCNHMGPHRLVMRRGERACTCCTASALPCFRRCRQLPPACHVPAGQHLAASLPARVPACSTAAGLIYPAYCSLKAAEAPSTSAESVYQQKKWLVCVCTAAACAAAARAAPALALQQLLPLLQPCSLCCLCCSWHSHCCLDYCCERSQHCCERSALLSFAGADRCSQRCSCRRLASLSLQLP